MDIENVAVTSDELKHWGIKGMRWGVRRYQTKDGALTAAGRKRYNEDMAKVEAETKKIQAQQRAKARTEAKLDKLEAAKKKLQDLKTGKKDVDDGPDEDIETKKARILSNPNPKEISENAALFTYNELNAAYMRMSLERNIKSLVPQEVDRGQEFVDKAGVAAKKVVDLVDSGSKTWNSVAKVYNSLWGNKNGTELPFINEKTVSVVDKLREKAETAELQNRLKKAEKEANKKPTENETQKAKAELLEYENRIRKAEYIRDQQAKGDFSGKTPEPPKNNSDDEEKDDD